MSKKVHEFKTVREILIELDRLAREFEVLAGRARELKTRAGRAVERANQLKAPIEEMEGG